MDDINRFELDAPWGFEIVDLGSSVAIVEILLKQLRYFKSKENDSQALIDDIQGYEELLNSKNAEANCFMFSKVRRIKYMSTRSNLDVIKCMKDKGDWK